VKKVCVILLLPVFLLNNSLGEAFKLPALFAHFLEHRQQDSSVGLGDFISMHYWGDDRNADDQDRDMQLPYKKICGAVSYEIAQIPAAVAVLGKQAPFTLQTVPLAMRDFLLSDPAKGCLFKPPRA
jgi:hypothetical protein